MHRDSSTYGNILVSALARVRENPVSFALIPAFLFLLAFIPRAVDPGTGLTTDELAWLSRAPRFISALAQGNFSGTYAVIHPGVTVMWLSGICMKLFIRPGMDFPTTLAIARFPVVLITSLGIVLMFFFLRCLLPEKTALLASVLIALDPFYLAHSRFIHLDALLTTFMVLSVLSFLVWIRRPRASVFLLMAGGFLGIGLLTKQPAESLIPYFLLVLVLWQLVLVRQGAPEGEKTCGGWFSAPSIRSVLQPFLILLLIAGVVFVIFWPVMWVAPLATVQKLGAGLENVVENPHERIGYFLGRVTTTDNYGPGFYPLVLAMRLTPLTLVFSLLGFLLCAGWLWKRKFSRENLTLFFLLLFIALFTLLMTIGEKKFDRYLLPVFPMVDILAALGICTCSAFVAGRMHGTGSTTGGILTGGRWFTGLLLLVVVLQAALIVPVAPYYLSYTNPVVLGGPAHAPEYLLIGWGEGQDLAAAYLNTRPGADQLKVFVQYSGFSQYFSGQITKDAAAADYLVFYSCAVQRLYDEELWNRYREKTPEKVIVLNGIEYCWIYPVQKGEPG